MDTYNKLPNQCFLSPALQVQVDTQCDTTGGLYTFLLLFFLTKTKYRDYSHTELSDISRKGEWFFEYVSFAGHTFGALVVCLFVFSIFLNCTMNLKIEIRFVCDLKFNYNCTTIIIAPFRIMM